MSNWVGFYFLFHLVLHKIFQEVVQCGGKEQEIWSHIF